MKHHRNNQKNQKNKYHKNNKNHRTIVVGDVHGSLLGFERFLKKIEHNPKRDTLVMAGDIVAKGPQSLKAIDRLIELRAKCVRGNHDAPRKGKWSQEPSAENDRSWRK